MSAYSFESKNPIPVRVLSFHFAVGKMKTAISPHIFLQSKCSKFRSPMSLLIATSPVSILPPIAEKKIQSWIRSRHVICSGNFFVFETVDYAALERFNESIKSLGGTVVSIDAIGKIWIGGHRQVVLYRARASLHTPHHNLKHYWIKYGNFKTRFQVID
jgi:phycoerythrin-associated linker protein